MIEFRKVSNAKVAPSSGVKLQANKARKLFPRWPNRGARKRLVYNGKRRRDADMLHANRSGYVFLSLLGLSFICGGSALTWYGTQSEVKDLLLIGPGSIVIGFLCIVVGAAFVARMMYYRWYADREAFDFGRVTPPEDSAPPPAATVLYGEQEMASIQQVVTPPTCHHNPGTATDNTERHRPNDGPIERNIQVTNDTTSAQMKPNQCSGDNIPNYVYKDCPKTSDDTHNNNSLDNKQRSRPDSGYGV